VHRDELAQPRFFFHILFSDRTTMRTNLMSKIRNARATKNKQRKPSDRQTIAMLKREVKDLREKYELLNVVSALLVDREQLT